MKTNKKKIFIIILLFFITYHFNIKIFGNKPEQENYNFLWKQICGGWEYKKENDTMYIYEKKVKRTNFNFNELLNHNSIVSYNPIEKYSLFVSSIKLSKPVAENVSSILFFSEHPSNIHRYKDFFGFKLIGNWTNINKVIFIRSKTNDPSQELKIKNNYTITELASKDITLEYEKKYDIKIKVWKKWADLVIDGKSILRVKADENLDSGSFGFSNRNAHISIYDVKVYNGRKIVFEDDFSQNKIYIPTIRMQRISKEEYLKRQKEKEEKEKRDKEKQEEKN